MANSIFSTPNWIDETSTIIFGGSWDATQNLNKLKEDDINDPAISSDDAEASTKFDFDLGNPRDIRCLALLAQDISITGKVRFQLSLTPSFSGATVSGSALSGATTLTFQAPTGNALNIEAGDVFTVAGSSTLHTVSSPVTIAAGATGSVTFTTGLTNALSGGEAITCRTGDYGSPEYDDGALVDAYGVIYPWGTLPYFHPSWWTGKPTQSDIEAEPFPIRRVLAASVFARYGRVTISDTSNPNNQVTIGRLWVGRGEQYTYNIAYGATSIGFITETKVDRTLSGRRVYNEKPMQRLLPLEIQNLPTSEAMTRFYDMVKRLNLNKQLLFIFDPDDVALMHRRTILATMAELDPIQYPYFDVNNVGAQLIEVI